MPWRPAGRLRHHLQNVIDWGLARQIAGVVRRRGHERRGSPAAPRRAARGRRRERAPRDRLHRAAAAGALPRPEALDRRGLDRRQRPQPAAAARAAGRPPGRRARARWLARCARWRAWSWPPRSARSSATCRAACSASTSSSLLDPTAPARLLFVAPNLDEAAASSTPTPTSCCAGSRCTRPRTRCSSPACRGCASTWPAWSASCCARPRSRSTPGGCCGCPDRPTCKPLVDAVREGDLLSLVIGPEQRALLDRVQATMAVLEGYAEHVMDAVGADVLADLPSCAPRWSAAAATARGLLRLLERLLGLDLKLRQYELGKAFCDARRRRRRHRRRSTASGPGRTPCPTLAELEDPRRPGCASRVPDWLQKSRDRLTPFVVTWGDNLASYAV